MGWLRAAGIMELTVLLAGVAIILLVLDRACRRPDFPVQGLYFEAGLNSLTRFAETVPALGALLVPGFLGRIVVFLGVTGLAILRPGRVLAGRALWLAAIAVPLTALGTDRIVGIDFVLEDRAFSAHHRIFLLLGVTALFVTPRLEVATITRLAKLVLGVYLVLSMGTFLLGLDDASSWFGAFLPGVDQRVSGIFDHPNRLGPAALLYLVLEYVHPSRRLVRLATSTLAFTLLVLSQSKTALVAAVAVGLVLLASRWEPRKALAASGVALTLAMPAVLLTGIQPGDIVEELPIAHVDTLTGRTDLWEMGWDLWVEAPVVGHGSGVFLTVAEQTGERWRAQAHNEYIQALAESGLVGLLALIAYLAVLLRIAARHAAATRNASMALVTILLLQTFTEVHLVSFDLPHMTVLALLFAWERQARHPQPDDVSSLEAGAAPAGVLATSAGGSPNGRGSEAQPA
jgi:O-antigen ligase